LIMHNITTGKVKCQICGSETALLDVVDFNKSCEEARGKYLPISGIPIYYTHCPNCSFTFAPEFGQWTEDDFLKRIYNERYIDVDPDYLEVRPRTNAEVISNFFSQQKGMIKHLDYGGGNGKLSALLKEKGWDSLSYDPFPRNDIDINELGKFNFITALEVFEHVPDVNRLMNNLCMLMDNSCLILFSTMTTDGNIRQNNRITWWYASPRNGHISLFSKKSLMILGNKYGLGFKSISNGVHCYVNQTPVWARNLIN